MNFFVIHFKGVTERIMRPFRERYHRNKAKKFKGPIPSIISINCIGGVMLHDLGCRFNTPTINLFFRTQQEFFYFVMHLEIMMELPLEEIKNSEYNAPVGVIKHNENEVGIVFLHYKDFQSANEKWQQRIKRINLDNVVVLLEGPQVDRDIINDFDEIPYKKKIISCPIVNAPEYYQPLDIYEKWHPGKILDYKSVFSVERYLDDWDYISFLKG